MLSNLEETIPPFRQFENKSKYSFTNTLKRKSRPVKRRLYLNKKIII